MNRLKIVNDSSTLQIYKIVEIYRQHKLIELYVLKLLWYNKEILLTASSQMTLEIKHGGFFEGDFIEINKVDSEGIILILQNGINVGQILIFKYYLIIN